MPFADVLNVSKTLSRAWGSDEAGWRRRREKPTSANRRLYAPDAPRYLVAYFAHYDKLRKERDRKRQATLESPFTFGGGGAADGTTRPWTDDPKNATATAAAPPTTRRPSLEPIRTDDLKPREPPPLPPYPTASRGAAAANIFKDDSAPVPRPQAPEKAATDEEARWNDLLDSMKTIVRCSFL